MSEDVRKNLSENSLKVLKSRYLKRDANGDVCEKPNELFERVADNVAKPTKNFDDDRSYEEEKEEFLDILTKFEFIPNSPTLMNAGNKLNQLSACFVLPVADSMVGIFSTLKEAALVHKSGGGTGYSFSRLRPSGDIVKGTGGIASGPITFMEVYDQATETIKQGGKRRGANMGILRVDHPDIEEFITAKEEEGKLANFNISVAIDDEFMSCLDRGEDFYLVNPHTGEKTEKKDPQTLFNTVTQMAWKNGEPGIIFLDRINEDNPFPVEGPEDEHWIESTNPCVTGDTLISTSKGLFRAEELYKERIATKVVVDGRLSDKKLKEASSVYKTGTKEVYALKTEEGYELKLTADHRVKTEEGWVAAKDLKPNVKIHILNRGGGFGYLGTREEGRVLGWMVGDGQIKQSEERAVLHFYDKDTQLSEMFAEHVNNIIRAPKGNGDYEVGVQAVERSVGHRNKLEAKEERVRSARLYEVMEEYGLTKEKLQVPDKLFRGSKQLVKGFLQGLFTADGSVQGTIEKGISIRLSSSKLSLLKQVQQLLLNFAIPCQIYENRRQEGYKKLPDGRGGKKKYKTKAQHELMISKSGLKAFQEKIGFLRKDKSDKLDAKIKQYSRGPYASKFTATIDAITDAGKEDVFDLTEPETHSFIANGIVVHNCGEQPLEPHEACNLGHINLGKLVKGDNGDGEIDWDKLDYLVDAGVRFLDNVVDASDFPIDRITEKAEANRKIGLGVMGFHDLLIKLGVVYGSEESFEIAEKVMKRINQKAKEVSQRLAEERGAFPNFEESIYAEEGEPKIRNATRTTIAPTGTTSIIANASQGIEPLYSVAYKRNVKESLGHDLLEVNSVFEQIAKERGYYSEELMEKIAGKNSIQDLEEIPEDVRQLFVTAHDLTPEQHIRVQAAFQKYTDNAVSKTVNFPQEAEIEDVAEVYKLAYELGCKGVTVYRSGSRTKQVLSTGEGEEEEIEERERPEIIQGTTQKIQTGYGSMYVTINEDENGIFEVFTQIGKAGGFTQSFTEALSRLVSLGLQYGIKPDKIIRQIGGIRSPKISYDNGDKILSIPDGMAKAIERYLKGEGKVVQSSVQEFSAEEQASDEEDEKEGQGVKKMVDRGISPECPECGAMLEYTEGCVKCPSCGWSEC